jgi:large subunit ribosomal protein L15
MKYNELNISSTPSRKRVGRGIAAGQGKTAGRGTKGQGARTGSKFKPTFSGGQLPLMKALPKSKGFKSMKSPAQVVYLDVLSAFKGKTVDNKSLYEAGFVATPFHTVKVIARGEISVPVTLRVQAASKSVQAAIVAAGGTFEKTDTPIRESAKTAEAKDK